MKIKRHAASGLFSFKTPARYSQDNKRKELYFKTERKAQEKRAEIENQYLDHRVIISPTDRAAVTIINDKYGGFRRALTALDHYEKNVAKIRSISSKDSVEQYIKLNVAPTRRMREVSRGWIPRPLTTSSPG